MRLRARSTGEALSEIQRVRLERPCISVGAYLKAWFYESGYFRVIIFCLRPQIEMLDMNMKKRMISFGWNA